MHSKLEDWKNGWFGVELGFSTEEIDSLIERLKMIQKDPDQHFHLSSNYKAAGGIGDILICIQNPSDISNMDVGTKARAPGDEIG